MSTQELVFNLPLIAHLDDGDVEDEKEETDDSSEGDVDEEWGADISVGDEEEGKEKKKTKEEDGEEEDDEEEEEEDENE